MLQARDNPDLRRAPSPAMRDESCSARLWQPHLAELHLQGILSPTFKPVAFDQGIDAGCQHEIASLKDAVVPLGGQGLADDSRDLLPIVGCMGHQQRIEKRDRRRPQGAALDDAQRRVLLAKLLPEIEVSCPHIRLKRLGQSQSFSRAMIS